MRSRLMLCLAVLLAIVVAAPLGAQAAGGDPAPDPKVAQLEVDFLTGMIPHHRSAITMAEMALMKATKPELRAMAQKEISEQEGEIEKMTHYLRDWYGMEPPVAHMMTPEMMMKMDMPMLRGMMTPDAEMMERLEAANGQDFDIEFMRQMTDHHSMAIMMASAILMNGHHADLYKLANNIVLSQAEEIHQMDDWLDAWYGVARP